MAEDANAGAPERRSGWRAVLSDPRIFDSVQAILGARRYMANYVTRHLQPQSSQSVLDIGCGTGALLQFMPDVSFVGFDHSQAYIAAARERFGGRGQFHCDDVANFRSYNDGAFDLVNAYGILHHITDEDAIGLFRIAHDALRPGGRLATADPCYVDGLSALKRYVISLDRGQNVRRFGAYEQLARQVFPDVRAVHETGYAPVPYSVCVLVCTKGA